MKASVLASRSGGKSAQEKSRLSVHGSSVSSHQQKSGFCPGVLPVPCTATGNRGLPICSADLQSLVCDSGAS